MYLASAGLPAHGDADRCTLMNLCFSEVTTEYGKVLSLLSNPVDNSGVYSSELLN